MLSRLAVAAASSRSESRRIRSAFSRAAVTNAPASSRADSSSDCASARACRWAASDSADSVVARSSASDRDCSCTAIWAANSCAALSRRWPRVDSKSAAAAAALARWFS